jgi:peptidoglycan/LPS O-acetylase OafA/YrhL
MKPNYIKELDGLRAIAILLVIIWHYLLGQTTPDMLPTKVWMLLSWSWSGVDLFFVLSGFLIGRILIYYKTSPNYFKTFYMRRVLRIFPLYYLSLLLFFVCMALGMAKTFPVLFGDSIPYISYPLYIQNWFMVSKGFGPNWLAVTWSLAVEEQFYLLFPFVIYFVNNKHLPKIFIICILLAPLLRGIIGGYGAYVLLPARMDALLVGALIAYYYQNGSIQKYLAPHARTVATSTLLLFGIILVLAYRETAKYTGDMLNHSLYAIFYGMLIITILVSKSKIIGSGLGNPVLMFIGKVSYSIYLIHQIVLIVLTKLISNKDVPWIDDIYKPDSIKVTLISLGVTLILATLSYYAFEKPLQKIGKRYDY